MNEYSEEALRALAEYISASDKCAKEPDETYGAAFIAMEPQRGRLRQFFLPQEIDAIIVNSKEIREILSGAGLMPE